MHRANSILYWKEHNNERTVDAWLSFVYYEKKMTEKCQGDIID